MCNLATLAKISDSTANSTAHTSPWLWPCPVPLLGTPLAESDLRGACPRAAFPGYCLRIGSLPSTRGHQKDPDAPSSVAGVAVLSRGAPGDVLSASVLQTGEKCRGDGSPGNSEGWKGWVMQERGYWDWNHWDGFCGFGYHGGGYCVDGHHRDECHEDGSHKDRCH